MRRVEPIRPRATAKDVVRIERILQRVAPEHVRTQLERAAERITHDPAGAVTLARTVLESTFKHIVAERQEGSQQTEKPAQQLNVALEVLGFPSSGNVVTTGTPTGLDKVVRGLRTVVEGLSQFRNRYSDAHGHDQSRTPVMRDARFAVSTSEVVAVFLLEVLEEREMDERLSAERFENDVEFVVAQIESVVQDYAGEGEEWRVSRGPQGPQIMLQKPGDPGWADYRQVESGSVDAIRRQMNEMREGWQENLRKERDLVAKLRSDLSST